MIPTDFEESNARLGAPEGFEESQVMTIPAFVGEVVGGSVDGVRIVVVAWKPTEPELAELNQGGSVFLSCIGGLPPHFLSTKFTEAIKPS